MRQHTNTRTMQTKGSARLRFAFMAAEHVERIGARIRQRREELGLSRGEVARQMPGKTNENAIYRWEKGLHAANPDTLEALATVLNVEAAYFYVDQPAGDTPDIGEVLGEDALSELRIQLDRIETLLASVVDALGIEEDADVHPLEQINQIAAALPGLLATDDGTAATTETQPAGS